MKIEKLVNYLKKRNKEDKELRDKYHKSNDEIMFHYLCGEYDFSEKLIRLIKQGVFD